MGVWAWLGRQLESLRREAGGASPMVSYVERMAAGSPAGPFHGAHDDEQARIVAAAFAEG